MVLAEVQTGMGWLMCAAVLVMRFFWIREKLGCAESQFGVIDEEDERSYRQE
jgi:hypothetical protein